MFSCPASPLTRIVQTRLAVSLLALCMVALGLATLSASAQAGTGYHLSAEFSTDEGTEAKGVTVDPTSKKIYVAAPFRTFTFGVVEQFSETGELLNTFEASEPYFSGVAVNSSNEDVYVYDDNKQAIDAFDSAGAPADVFAGSSSLSVTGGKEVEVQIASDTSGDIYYPNQKLGELQEFLPDGSPGPVAITGLTRPADVAVTSTKIYVVDASPSGGGTQVQQFDSSGTPVGTGLLGNGVLAHPAAVAVDPSGDVFVLDQTTEGTTDVDVFDSAGALIQTFGEGFIATTAGSKPVALAAESSATIYVLEDHTSTFPPKSVVLTFSASATNVPTALTESAEDIEATTGTVTGTLNPEGSDTRYFFQYGTSTAYGQSTAELDAGSGTTTVDTEAALSLAPNQTYHYRIVATNEEGDRVYGADREFTTRAESPGVGAGAVSGITETDAVLETIISPNSEPTTYYFMYVDQADYEAGGFADAITVPTPPGPEAGAGGQEDHEQQDVSGLSPGTAYDFEVVAINATGTTDGPLEHFTTLEAPLAETEASTAITKTTAMLSGDVTTYSKPTLYWFAYVNQADFEADGFSKATTVPQPEGDIEANTQPVPVTTFIEGLTPDTTYHVRLFAYNEGGIREGPEVTFTTVVLPPSASTGLPVSSTPTAVTVNGGVNPEHGDTTYHFQYVDEAEFLSGGYQDAANMPEAEGDAGSSGETEIVTATFSGLSSSTTYHYRLVATNAGGTTEGLDETFTTAGEGGTQTDSGGHSPFGSGTSTAPPLVAYPDLLSLSPTPVAKSSSPVSTSAKPLTRVQKLAAALRACKRDGSKSKRRACEMQAKKRYRLKPKPKKKSKKKQK
jgi:hypothetical protein